MKPRLLQVALGSALFLLAAGARADWLVFRSGHRIETRGGWEVKGRIVAFTDAQGKLQSVWLEEIDLDASEAATEAAQGPKAATGQEADPGGSGAARGAKAKKPVLTLTDADVGHVDPRETVTPAEAERPRVTLYMTSWCGYCRRARALLKELGVPFLEKDIERNRQAAAEYRRKGRGYTGVPLLDIDGTILRGYNEQRIRELVAKLPKAEPERGS